MPENGMPGPVCDLSSVRESVCIHTKKIFDSCRDFIPHRRHRRC